MLDAPAAGTRIHRLRQRRVRTKAQSLGRLHRLTCSRQPADDRLPRQPRQPAHRVIRDPQPRPRHARRHPRPADQWLQAHLGSYANWSSSHNSLLVIITDEDDNSQNNRIATILVGAHVRPGRYDTPTNHYGLLRTLLDSYQLTPFAEAAHTPPLETAWSS